MLRILATAGQCTAHIRHGDFSLSKQRLICQSLNLRFRRLSSLPEHHHNPHEDEQQYHAEIRRLTHLRNVGILAHVDAGKTTVTERMLALAGVVRRPGSVDDGNTVTDYLPAERERGITIQSAAISFEWMWHNHYVGDDYDQNDSVQIHLIDTPGHVDFSVEVNRSVAVLDGAVLVVDAVAGVQAQTETVWRAMTRPSLNNHDATTQQQHSSGSHEPLPCLALINKMDKEGRNFQNAIMSLKHKLPGANPIAVQLPVFRALGKSASDDDKSSTMLSNILTGDDMLAGDFIGVVDLVHMRLIIYPDVSSSADIEANAPTVISLVDPTTHEALFVGCRIAQAALEARSELIAALANVDDAMEEYFLLEEEEPTNAEIRGALRRATLARRALPCLAGAALKGRGIELVLDSIADLLPSPLDRMPPALTKLGKETKERKNEDACDQHNKITLGHALHPSLVALAFKVLHMKGRGGSGDGRVVFCRVYSGQLRDRDVLQIHSPPPPGEEAPPPRTERVGAMLELSGGRFDTLPQGSMCQSGDVCALVGLRSVVTGDTIVLPSPGKGKKNNKGGTAAGASACYLAGVASPKPVLQVRLEAETSQEQKRLSEALALLVIEDPSLVVQETESTTLLSGLGELHIEVTLDRLAREFGLRIVTGKPAVAYRESITGVLETDGLLNYDRTIGTTRLQAAIHLRLEPTSSCADQSSPCILLSDPTVSLGPEAREFLGIDADMEHESMLQLHDVAKTLVLGCQGALKRGPLRSYALSNLHCTVVNIDAEGGLSSLQSMPGALRAAAANAVSELLQSSSSSFTNSGSVVLMEPTMSVEVTVPSDQVGVVLSDLTGRRGTVGDVMIGDNDSQSAKALVRGEVPLVEILGYANSLRSLTGGEGAFTAEYKGHTPCDEMTISSSR